MSWYNLTCRSGGSNMNAGATDGVGECAAAPLFTFTNGAWNGTNVFTASGAPDLSGLVVGHRVSVALDADTTPTTNQYITAYITVVDNTTKTITVGTIVTKGSVLGVNASGVTLRVGGAFRGPNGTSSHPLDYGASNLFALSTNPTRINLKNDAVYNVTAAVGYSTSAQRVQGYTTAFGDGGKFIVDGGVVGASYTLFTLASANIELYDFELRNNGATGSAAGLTVTGPLVDVRRGVVHDVRGAGISVSNRTCMVEVETYNCNQSNTATIGAFGAASNAPTMWTRCVAHDNSGSNSSGWRFTSTTLLYLRDCVADTNGNGGYTTSSVLSLLVLTSCDAYGNASDGVQVATTTSIKPFFLTDCNFVANGGYGVNGTGASYANGRLTNCGFGSGTAANTSGATNSLGDTVVESSVTYGVNLTPWVDPANGNFTPQGAALGRGTGLATGAPDRAAAQVAAGTGTGGGSGGGMISSGF